MAYLISEEANDLLQDVREFCENEVKEQCKDLTVQENGRKRFMIKRSRCSCTPSKSLRNTADRVFPE